MRNVWGKDRRICSLILRVKGLIIPVLVYVIGILRNIIHLHSIISKKGDHPRLSSDQSYDNKFAKNTCMYI